MPRDMKQAIKNGFCKEVAVMSGKRTPNKNDLNVILNQPMMTPYVLMAACGSQEKDS